MFHTLVFSGGAHLATAFIGVLKYMEHTGLRKGIRRVVGSSAGAFMSLLVALGHSSPAIHAWTTELTTEFHMNRLSIDRALEFYDTYGIDDGTTLRACLRATLSRKFKQPAEEVTFKDLVQLTGVDLVVCVLNVSKQAFEYKCVDKTPNMPVITAIHMSMALPFLFAPVRYKGDLFVDPVFGRNFPMDYTTGASDAQGVLGVHVHAKRKPMDMASENLASYAASLLSIVFNESNNREGVTVNAQNIIDVEIDDSTVGNFDSQTMEFPVTEASVAYLIRTGYAAAQRHLDKTLSREHHADFLTL